MRVVQKACPVVVRMRDDRPEVLAFQHPLAGKQFVKGTIAAQESPAVAALRELREESGLTLPLCFIGARLIGRQRWHFFLGLSSGLPETWQHQTEDDCGHVFAFFWQPISQPLDHDWHPTFHQAFDFFVPRIRGVTPE